MVRILAMAAALALVGCTGAGGDAAPDLGGPVDAGSDGTHPGDVGALDDAAAGDAAMGDADAAGAALDAAREAGDAGPGPRPIDGALADSGAPDGRPVDAGAADGDPPDAGPVPLDCVGPQTAGDARWVDGQQRADVVVEGHRCQRTFTLSTTTPLRHGRPDNPRVIRERVGGPAVRTGDPFFDGLYALAVEEAAENAVPAIRDGAFRGGEALPCPAGGCFETGRLWSYVWTRDTAYSVDLGLGLLDPQRALNSLVFKTSAPRGGGPRRIVQDTGTGGSWPVSTDRVTWALGARALVPLLEREAAHDLMALAREALSATARDDDEAAFDPTIGLYRGEQSFLDWREQSYPDWTAEQPAHIAMSAALGTNVAHYAARRWLAALERGEGRGEQAAWWDAAADALRAAIRQRLLTAVGPLPSAFLTTTLDRAPTRQYDLLGTALAILEGVLDADEGRAALSAWPLLPGGPPVIWPQQQFTPIYHNRGQWPFVTAYFARAAARVRHAAALEAAVETLMRGAALNLSNMENFEAVSGRAWVDDGEFSGPVVNSQRQLWSVAGYLGVVHEALFGLRFEVDRLRIAPGLTRRLRARWFDESRRLVLAGVRWRRRVLDVTLVLPAVGGDGPAEGSQGYRVAALRVDGVAVADPAEGIALQDLERGRHHIEAELAPAPWPAVEVTRVADPSAWRTVFAPRSPTVEGLAWTADGLEIAVSARDDGVRIELLRDGVMVVGDLAEGFVDHEVSEDDRVCYSARAVFRETGLTSQHAEPRCWWGRDGRRVVVFEAPALTVIEGERADEHGRPHIRDPGGGGVSTPVFVPGYDGLHAIQVVYGNGAGPIASGVTCAVRTVDAVSVNGGQVVGGGTVVLPHLGAWDRWADSSFAFAELWQGQPYRIQIHGSRVGNMSRLAHFAEYTGGAGGVDGPLDAANIAAVKVLAFDPQGPPPAHEPDLE